MLKLQLILLILSTAFVLKCMADTCQPFQYKHELYERDRYNYCKNGMNGTNNTCCANSIAINIRNAVNNIAIRNVKTGLNCQQLTRELLCHYSCSHNLNVTFNTVVNRFQPQFTKRFIQQFIAECSNSRWCGSGNFVISSDKSCYTIKDGQIVYNENSHIKSLELSPIEFASKVLDAGIGGTRTQDPPEFDEEIITNWHILAAILMYGSLVGFAVMYLTTKMNNRH